MKLILAAVGVLLSLPFITGNELGPFTVSLAPSLELKVHDTASGALLFSNTEDAVFHAVQQSLSIVQSQGGVFDVHTTTSQVCTLPVSAAKISVESSSAKFPMGAVIAVAEMCQGTKGNGGLHWGVQWEHDPEHDIPQHPCYPGQHSCRAREGLHCVQRPHGPPFHLG